MLSFASVLRQGARSRMTASAPLRCVGHTSVMYHSMMSASVLASASLRLMKLPRSISVSTDRDHRSASVRVLKVFTSSANPLRRTRTCHLHLVGVSMPFQSPVGQEWDKIDFSYARSQICSDFVRQRRCGNVGGERRIKTYKTMP